MRFGNKHSGFVIQILTQRQERLTAYEKICSGNLAIEVLALLAFLSLHHFYFMRERRRSEGEGTLSNIWAVVVGVAAARVSLMCDVSLV